MKLLLFISFCASACLAAEENTIKGILVNKEQVEESSKKIEDPKLLDENVCELKDEDFKKLTPFMADYVDKLDIIDSKTGTPNAKYVLEKSTSQEMADNFWAAVCEEQYDMQKSIQEKAMYIYRRYFLREANCEDLPDRAEACKSKEGEEKVEKKKRNRKN